MTVVTTLLAASAQNVDAVAVRNVTVTFLLALNVDGIDVGYPALKFRAASIALTRLFKSLATSL
jgi:hypothetical protein